MEPYIQFTGTLQNSGFWAVQVWYVDSPETPEASLQIEALEILRPLDGGVAQPDHRQGSLLEGGLLQNLRSVKRSL